MKHFINFLALLLLISLLPLKNQAQNGPTCTAYQNKKDLDGTSVFAAGNTVYASFTNSSYQGGLAISTDRGNTFTTKTAFDLEVFLSG